VAEPVCVVPAGDRTGEGIVWHAAEKAVYWTDINRFLIHRFEPATGSVRSWFFQEPVTTIGLTDRDDRFIVALGSRVILWSPATDARSDLARPEPNVPRARLNDGRPDPAGFFWVGSMQNNVGPDGGNIPVTDRTIGSLYRIAADGAVEVFKSGFGIANTLAWSPDRKLFYFADTLANIIWTFSYDATDGTIGNERPFFSGYTRGGPDGSAVDRDGFVWNARYGGGCVVRISPAGKIDRVVEMPVGNVTTCTFGGDDLKTLYITTAQGGRGKSERLAGGLYGLAVDIPGLPENRFHLKT
jgi:sugar lactone lactonase YvrE